MFARYQRFIVSVAGLVLGTTIFVLGRQKRALRDAYESLDTQMREVHRGLLLPPIMAKSLEGDTVRLATPTGDDRQVLFFISASCKFCSSSLPTVVRLDSALHDRGELRAHLYLVSLDSAATISTFASAKRLKLPIFAPADKRLRRFYRVNGIPQLIVVDSSGRVLYARAGELIGRAALDTVLRGVAWRPKLLAPRSGVAGLDSGQRTFALGARR